ncbi:hypothetical protein HC031_15425 [Planosporangium thailandense]|uniref:YncE family protein n=1 Tax=Planosporangium thailandense TaxID=765197 RepID=A0ABX0XYW9_9ACTN|nr:hypothetical protein [Planosporangium thailandense]NJC71092.1 hypothetical protein [Planosporangium thailandense]
MKVRPALSVALLAMVAACAPDSSDAHPVTSQTRSAHGSVGTIVETLPVADGANAMAFDGRYLWVAGAGGAVSQVDTTIGQVIRTVKLGGHPDGVTVSPEGVWVADSAGGTVTRLDLGSGRILATVKVGPAPVSFAQIDRDLWVFSQSDARARVVDPRAGRVSRTVGLPGPAGGDGAVAGGAIWMPDTLGTSQSVWRLDPASGQVTTQVKTGPHPAAIVFGFSAAWVTHDEGVSRIDPTAGRETTRVANLGHQTSGIAVTTDAVWVTSPTDNRLSKIDPTTNAAVASLDVCGLPGPVAVVGDDVWVACRDTGMLVQVHPG